MTKKKAFPCEHCQKALHKHNSLEYLYCGHNHVVAFRFSEGHIDYVGVSSTEEAIQLIQDSGQESQPLPITA